MNSKTYPLQRHLPGLDGLRAVACLMVFAVHFGQMTRLQGAWGPFDLARLLENGNTGVALFFALSGFLLSLPYWHALESGTAYPAPGDYLLRRAVRVLPAYFVCLTILIVVNRFWEKTDWLRDVLLHYALAFNYLDATIFRINPPFWTLAVEAQFYLLLPLVFLLARRMSARNGMVMMLALGAAAYLAHYVTLRFVAGGAGSGPAAEISPVLTYSLLAHLPHFLMGVATGWVFVARNLREWIVSPPYSAGREVTLWAAVVLVVIALSTPAGNLLEIPYGRYNLPFVPALLCVLILVAPITVSGRRLLDSPPLRWIGTVSYGVYIFHLPLQHATARYMGQLSLNPREHWILFGVVSLGLTLAGAAASYRLLEKPILDAVKTRRRPLRDG